MTIVTTISKDVISADTLNGTNAQDYTEAQINSRESSNYSQESFLTRLKTMVSRLEDGSLEKKAIVKVLLCLEI